MLTGKPILAPIPTMVLILSLLVLWGGMRLLRRYDFSYKHNFIKIVTAVIIIIFALGFLLDSLGINQYLERKPRFNQLYQQHQPPGFSNNQTNLRPHRGRQF